MSYRIINKQGRALTGFYSNGGFELRDVFAFSKFSWKSFKTEKEVQEYLLYLIVECRKQQDRWGDFTDKAEKFARSLDYEVID